MTNYDEFSAYVLCIKPVQVCFPCKPCGTVYLMLA